MEDLHVNYEAGAMQKQKEKMGMSEHNAPASDYGTYHAKSTSEHLSGGASHVHESMPKSHDGNFKKP